MKAHTMTPCATCFTRLFKLALLVVTLAILTAISPALAGQGNVGNPGILPPHSHAYGKTYGAWSTEWWKWTFSLPTNNHPLFDTADCSAGQSGKVWFLGGTFTVTEVGPSVVVGQAERHCTIPSGTALFFPVLNGEADNVGADPPLSVEELYALVQANQDHVVFLEATIDGRPVQGLSDPINTPYRVQSPDFFSFTLPEENNLYQFFDFDVSGTISPAVADGVFLMLAPMSVGEHTIHFAGRSLFTEDPDGFDQDFSLDITYHVTVD